MHFKRLHLSQSLGFATLNFPSGLYGFETYTEYRLDPPAGRAAFFQLKARQRAGPSFWIVDPFLYYPKYRPVLLESDLRDIGVRSEGECVLLSLVNTHQTPYTLNLAAPILIHLGSRRGKQLLMPRSFASALIV